MPGKTVADLDRFRYADRMAEHAPKKFDPKFDIETPRAPLVHPAGLVCTPGPIEQVDEVPHTWFSGRKPERPDYPLPRGAMPSGAPSPTSPVNPNKPHQLPGAKT